MSGEFSNLDYVPNLFLVGAAKAGTTSLYQYLKDHPDIYAPILKEPNFFGSDIDPSRFRADYRERILWVTDHTPIKRSRLPRHNAFIRSVRHYESLYSDSISESYLLDASTSYLYSEKAAREIKTLCPEAKILIAIRDPVERTISHYKMDVSQGRQKEINIQLGISDDLSSSEKGYGISHLYLDLSLYYNQVLRYIENFNPDQILVIQFENLTNRTTETVRGICHFLGIEQVAMNLKKIYNPSHTLKNPVVKKLRRFRGLASAKAFQEVLNRAKSMLEKDNPVRIDEADRKWIGSFLEDDWGKTKELLKNTGIQMV